MCLAAKCGHEASQLVQGKRPERLTRAEYDEWLSDLGDHGREVLERVCIAFSRVALPIWVKHFPRCVHRSILPGMAALPELEIDPERPEETLGGIPGLAVERMERALLLSADRAGRESLDTLTALGVCEGVTLASPGETAASCAAVAIEYSNSAIYRASNANMAGMAGVVLIYARRALELDGHETPAAALEAKVESELAPWALGYMDPVRNRVEARQSAGA